jgi:acetyltransferase
VCLQVLASKPIVGLILLDIFTKTEKNEPTTVEHKIKFTQVDYDREVALIAIVNSKGDQKMVGVARVIFLPDGETGEFAIVLADHWQGKGIGAAMLMPCLRFSKQQGLKRVMGLVLSENIQMTKLGKRLGFRMKRDPDSYDIELEIDLDKIDFSAEMYN